MKNKNALIVVILLIITAGLAFAGHKKASAPVTVSPDTSTVPSNEDKEICYYQETKGDQYSDYAFTSVKYDSDGKVHGIMNWLPGEKDSLTGTYTGVVEGNTGVANYPTRLNVIYTASGEGIINKQQEILILGYDNLKQASGDKIQDEDGVYMFKDMNALSYGNQLQKVDCSVVPDRVKMDYSNQNTR